MDNSKLFFRAGELTQDLVVSRKEVFSKGQKTGFHTLDQIASFVKPSTTVIYSPPHVGKSVITLDILMAQAEMGEVVFIYSPEFRKVGELFQALIQTRLSRSFFGPTSAQITDDEYMEALEFVNRHFVVVKRPPREKDKNTPRMTIPNIFRHAADAQQLYGIKFGFIFADPFNYVDKTEQQRMLQEQEYVLDANDMLAEYSEALGVHTIISAHTRAMELTLDKETGKRYYGVGHPSEIMGGQSWERAGYQILHFWRAPEGVNDTNGIPYPANFTKIFNQKAKPWGSGKLGNTGDLGGMEGLYFDPLTYTMYEIIDGHKYYRNEFYATNSSNITTRKELNTQTYNEDEVLF